MTAEGSETPDGEAGTPPGGRGPEGDLLAERRARRAAESGETALVRRAEAAEATVKTLETHVATLQERLREAELERRRISELVEAEEVSATDRMSSTEHELRRAKQREYAEQRLRVEAEDRSIDVERESRLEIDRLTRRLSASEQSARELAAQLESVQRKLAEAEQAAATEVATVRRAEHAVQARLSDLERQALEIQRGLDAERAARERSERQLEGMRRGHRRVEGLVGDLTGVVARLRAAAATAPPDASEREGLPRAAEGDRGTAHRDQMAEALAAAVERLRARVEDVGEEPSAAGGARREPGREPGPEPPTRLSAPRSSAAPHKHSMSALTRWKIRRKDRRRRRSAAAEPPSMQSQ